MNNLLTVFTLLLVGISISAACNYTAVENCIRKSVDCMSAAQCENICAGREDCYRGNYECSSTLATLSSCVSYPPCPAPLSFTYKVKQICVPIASAASVPRSTVYAGFSAITVSLLTYLSKE